MDPQANSTMDPSQWPPSQDSGANSRVDSFERVYQKVAAQDQSRLNPGTSDAQQMKMDSLEKAFPQGVTMGSHESLDSGTVRMICQDLWGSSTNQDVAMDSMESIPSGCSGIINQIIAAGRSLPPMDDRMVEQSLNQSSTAAPHLAPGDELMMSPMNNQLEATYTNLEQYSPVSQPGGGPFPDHRHDQGQLPPHPLQHQGLQYARLDPNVEIHGGPGTHSHYQSPAPRPPPVDPVMFHKAVSTSQAAGGNETQDEVMSIRSTDSDESYKLSPESRMEITICYSNLPVSGTVMVDRPDGCLIYYLKASPDLMGRCQRVPFPSVKSTEIGKKFSKVSPKAMELTERALDALQGGLHLQWTNEGVYATRQSRGKIYWTSTQMDNDNPLAQELARNTPTMVFNCEKFRLELSRMYTLKAQRSKYREPVLPAIYFTFAQKWAKETCPISNCLVWAKVIPKKAEDMVTGLFPDAKPAPFASYNSGFLHMSSN